MSTVQHPTERVVYKTPEALSEGIAEGYRQLRSQVRTMMMTSPTATGPTRRETSKVIEALIPIMEKLTGRTRAQLLDATLRRIAADAGLAVK